MTALDLKVIHSAHADIETNGSDQGLVSPYAGQRPFIPTTPRPIDKNNFAPRMGVAGDLGGRGRTVVRGGFGIFYDASVARSRCSPSNGAPACAPPGFRIPAPRWSMI